MTRHSPIHATSDCLITAPADQVSGADFFRAVFHHEPSELDRKRREIGDRLMAAIREQEAKIERANLEPKELPNGRWQVSA